MIITCQACDTRFRLDDKLVRPTGSRARCSVCATIFTVYPESQPPAPVPEAPPQPEISRLTGDTFPQPTQPAPDTLKSDGPKDDRGHDLGDAGKVDSGDAGAAAFPMMAEDTETASRADEMSAGEDDLSADLDSFFAEDEETDDLDSFFGNDEETDLPSVEPPPSMTATGPDAVISEDVEDDALQGLDSFFSEADAPSEIKPDDDPVAAAAGPEAALEETESVMNDLDDDALMMEISGILDEAQKDETRKTDDTALAEDLDDGALTFSDADLNFSLDLVQEEKPAADDADLNLSLNLVQEEKPAAGDADLNLSLNLVQEEKPAAAETGSKNDDLNADDLDMALEMDDAFDGGRPGDTAGDTDLDFDADLDFILDMEPREDSRTVVSDPEPPIAEKGHQASELSLSDTELSDDLDLDFVLDMEPREDSGTVVSAPEPPIAEKGHQASELSLSDAELSDDLDLDFVLDMEPREDSGTVVSAPEPPIAEKGHQASELSLSDAELSDDLDLAGLDDLLSDSMDGAEHAESVRAGGEEPELSLDLVEETLPPAMGKDADDDSAEMTLDELKLELEERDTLTGKPATSDTDYSDIDLGEIEKMLDSPKTGAETGDSFSPSLDQELDLNILEASLDAEKWMTDAAGGMETVIMDEEIDLADFEEVIDAVDINASVDDSGEEPELELDLDEDHVSSETVVVNHDLDFELSDFDGSAGGASLQEISRSLDINASNSLDLDIDDDDLEETVAVHPSEPAPAADPLTSPPVSPASLPSSSPPSPEPATMEPAPRGARTAGATKKSSDRKKVAMVVLILLIILGGIAGAGYYCVVQQEMEVPYIDEHLDFLRRDPNGTKKLTTEKITNQHIENSSAGRLFVVSGTVKNGYRTNRGMIFLQGKLFSKGKEIREQAVYAGNVMSDLELTNLELNKIKERMGNRLGNNQQNMKIPPGRTIPFMIVFSEFEGEPDEFAVDLISSVAAR